MKLIREEKTMGKFKLLLDVVDDIRHLANSLEELVSVVKYSERAERGEILEDSKVERVEKVKDVEIFLEDVRGVLAKKSQEGFTDEIRSIIKEYNCEKLSEINPKYYLEILQKANKLGNE